MNIDDAVQAIKDTAEAEIKKLLAAEPEKEWEPDKHSWFVVSHGEAVSGVVSQKKFHAMGNAFKTKQEAEKAIARRKAYVVIVREIARVNRAEGWAVDWESGAQGKSSTALSHTKRELLLIWCWTVQSLPDELYGCEKAVQNIIDNYPDVWRTAMGIE